MEFENIRYTNSKPPFHINSSKNVGIKYEIRKALMQDVFEFLVDLFDFSYLFEANYL